MNFGIFDADQHYYEAEDCFTRYASRRMLTEKYIRWVTELDGKRRRLFVGGKEANVIGNPTFTPISTPGIYHETLKNLEVGKDRAADAYGKLEPIRACYRDKQVRIEVMDEQGVEKTLMFPTLGVTMEGFLSEDAEMLYDCFHAFNRWVVDDWGFAYRDRIFAAPYLCMLDLGHAIAELDWVLKEGARLITIRPGPAYGRSPADPYFDPFWARIEEAGVLVTYHSFEGPSEAGNAYYKLWAAPPQRRLKEHGLLKSVIAGNDTAILDTLSALVLHNLFGRFPKLKVAVIEMGASWVPYLLTRIDHAGGLVARKITSFGGTLRDKPSEILKRHVSIAPFPEEDVPALIRQIGADQVLMGSDWPHAESIPHPRDYIRCLEGVEQNAIKQIMHDNIQNLIH